MRGELIIAAISIVLFAIAFALLKVPFWGLIAVLCGLLGILPFGVALGILLAVIVTWAAGRKFWQVALVAVASAVVAGIRSYILTPKILGRELHLSAWTVFFAILIGGALFGFVGVLLAARVAAIAAVLLRFLQHPSGPHSAS